MTQRPDYYYTFDSTDGPPDSYENDRLRTRIAELEAREEAEATKIWQQAQRIAELEAALRYYSNPDNYHEDHDGTGIEADGGQRARRALERKP